MSNFDRLARACERLSADDTAKFSGWSRAMREAMVFEIDEAHWSIEADALLPDLRGLIDEGFLFLPAPAIALDMKDSAVVIWGEERSYVSHIDLDGRVYHGHFPTRSWKCVLVMDSNAREAGLCDVVGRDVASLICGTVEAPDDMPPGCEGYGPGLVVCPVAVVAVGEKGAYWEPRPVAPLVDAPEPDEVTRQMQTNAAQSLGQAAHKALRAVAIINRPSHFVVERQHVKSGRVARGRIARARQRPTYRLLNLELVRMTLRHDGREEEREAAARGEHAKRRPYFRRRHRKVLRSEFYTNKRGQTVDVSACWCGPREATHGGYRYRVRLDL